MAKVFVERPRCPYRDPRPMLHITIEPDSKVSCDASLSFETKHGFGFMMRTEDAIKMAAMIQRLAGATRRRAQKRIKHE
jgi:hypothetical protein